MVVAQALHVPLRGLQDLAQDAGLVPLMPGLPGPWEKEPDLPLGAEVASTSSPWELGQDDPKCGLGWPHCAALETSSADSEGELQTTLLHLQEPEIFSFLRKTAILAPPHGLRSGHPTTVMSLPSCHPCELLAMGILGGVL